MTPERWQRIEDLFHAARERAPDDRDAFLTAECAGDAALRHDVHSLLEQRDGTLLHGGLADAATLVMSPAHGTFEGRTLGSYVLGPLLGSGGMGEVYRARDTRLGREVAVKILPQTLGQHPERLARFEREARILAALNHPNIAAIYGLEESGNVRALVLELVDGITLAEKIRPDGNADPAGAATTALSIGEALAIARQIAEALETAHHKGIVHRDLKPANVKITPGGVVKVLDFGLAKIQAPEDRGPSAVPVLATIEGAVLGTVAYMSPEQARGLPVDKRTDIWAFGCVLYEMLTGRRSFPGQTSADVLGAITSTDPDWALLPPYTPWRVREILRRCLTKDADRRLHDLADARIEIEEAIGDPRPVAALAPPPPAARASLRHVAWMLTGIVASGVAFATWFVMSGTTREVVSPDGRRAYLVYAKPEGLLAAPFDLDQLRLTGPSMAVLPGVQTNLSGGAHYSVSPGGLLAYVPGQMNEGDKTLLWIDRDGTETAIAPVAGIGFQYRLSPDGRRLVGPNAAGANRDLWVHDLKDRGASIRLTFDGAYNSPIWTSDGARIIYTSGVPNGNLFWRAADGSGHEERLTTSANMQHAGSVSPDGKTLAYFELDPARGFDIWLLPLDGPRRPRLFLGTPRNEGNPRISPDGRWLAYQSNVSGSVEIHVASFPDAGRRRAISKGGGYAPLWSPNGRELYYRTAHPDQGGGRMMAVPIDTTGAELTIGTQRILFSEPYQANGDIAPDGRFLLLRPTPKESPARVIQLVLNWFDDLQANVPPQ